MTRQSTNRMITLVTMEELRQRYPEGSLEFRAAWFCGFRYTSGERYCDITLGGDGWTVEAPADIATLNRLNELGARQYMMCMRDDGFYLVTDGAQVLKAPEKPWHDGHEGNEDDFSGYVDITCDYEEGPVLMGIPKTETERLEDLIKERHPDWDIEVSPIFEGQKLVLLDGRGRYVCDTVCHRYSYGGEEGLLEWWAKGRGIDPVGWLTAEDALPLFEKAMRTRSSTGRLSGSR